MSIKTVSQSQLGQDTAKNSQIVTTAVKLINSGGGAAAGPNISSIIVTDSGYNNLDDTAAATSNSYIKILGTGFQSTANVFLNGTMVPKANVTFVSSTELRAVLPVSNTGNYAVSVYNSNSSGALYSSSFVISTMPQWLTSATLANVTSNTVFSTTLSATSDSSITYSNTTILPTGTTLLSNGYFYGNISVGADTTYTFDVKATDAENQDTTRTFSLTTVVSAYPYTLQYLVVAGGGGGGGGGFPSIPWDNYGAGGGAGGLITGSTTVPSAGRIYTATVGAGGGQKSNGNPSVFYYPANPATLYVETTGGGRGGGQGGSPVTSYNGSPGGSGGGGGVHSGPVTIGSGVPGQGNPGGTNYSASSGYGAGGGGGKNSAGGNGSSTNSGAGGDGYTWPYNNLTYAGGGGGSATPYGAAGAPGGSGGGGPGLGPVYSGSPGTGGGSGGGWVALGGGGTIILAIPTAAYPGSAPGATVTTPPAAPGMTVITFTNSGTFTT